MNPATLDPRESYIIQEIDYDSRNGDNSTEEGSLESPTGNNKRRQREESEGSDELSENIITATGAGTGTGTGGGGAGKKKGNGTGTGAGGGGTKKRKAVTHSNEFLQEKQNKILESAEKLEKEILNMTRQSANSKPVKFDALMKDIINSSEEGDQCPVCTLGVGTAKFRTLLSDKFCEFLKEAVFKLSIRTILLNLQKIIQDLEIECFPEYEPRKWSLDEIKYHLFNCMTDPVTFKLQQVTKWKKMLDLVENECFSEDQTGKVVSHDHKIKTAGLIQDRVDKLLTTEPEKYVSFNPQTASTKSDRKSAKNLK